MRVYQYIHMMNSMWDLQGYMVYKNIKSEISKYLFYYTKDPFFIFYLENSLNRNIECLFK